MKPINKTVCSLAALAPLAMAQSANAGQRPNIIFFLVDDFGWTETSLPFGEETYPNNLRFHTPNMERLARTGVMMTNAYACPVTRDLVYQHDDGHERRAHGHHVVLLLI